ncbi:MAG: anion transporter [Deltaproteobacteria bacterium]|nr:anion transporter [Deltaproteobacteria bacterium]
MDATVIIVFFIVYAGMFLGEIPGLALDRTGIALLGAIAFLATGHISPQDAWKAVDVSTMALLLGLMVISAQFRLGGFYAWITRRLARFQVYPESLLGMLIILAGALSAVLANDIVCLAMTPVLIEGCARRSLNPVPFLLALACASNIGSAATLIGNPQNMLIGQALDMSFSGYVLDVSIPVLAGLLSVWVVICAHYHNDWRRVTPVPQLDASDMNYWQTGKGLLVLSCVVLAFLFLPFPREIMALAAAALLLTSRRMATRQMLGLVDWQLLVLFAGLFIVNKVLATSGTLHYFIAHLAAWGIHIEEPAWLFGLTLVLSNLVSNVPAVMLLLPAATHHSAGTILALVSTFAGNLFIVGSIANIIVVEQARSMQVTISWQDHARIGIPVTMASLICAGAWLVLKFASLNDFYLIFK